RKHDEGIGPAQGQSDNPHWKFPEDKPRLKAETSKRAVSVTIRSLPGTDGKVTKLLSSNAGVCNMTILSSGRQLRVSACRAE
ncbi:hypothetical protein, partial [Caballeronia mineralivorans]|uniref:hypothetical protein n=1 Tax=Caballeronia mineralivorans TaxID=2010198 RepID=UPI0023F43CA1